MSTPSQRYHLDQYTSCDSIRAPKARAPYSSQTSPTLRTIRHPHRRLKRFPRDMYILTLQGNRPSPPARTSRSRDTRAPNQSTPRPNTTTHISSTPAWRIANPIDSACLAHSISGQTPNRITQSGHPPPFPLLPIQQPLFPSPSASPNRHRRKRHLIVLDVLVHLGHRRADTRLNGFSSFVLSVIICLLRSREFWNGAAYVAAQYAAQERNAEVRRL